jgi:hypothetical protein
LGWGGVTAWVGSYNRQDSSLNDTAGKIGSGLLMGARADSQLWITKDWFGELGFGYGYAGYSQLDIQSGAATAAAGVTASVTTFRFDIGYIYRATADVLGPRGWVKAGYKSTSYSLPISNTEATGPSSFGGMFIGIGGDMPMRGGFGALLNFDFGLITSATETGFLTGTVASALAANFFAGGYYRLQPRADIRLGIDVLANSANMSNGASLSHRVVSFGPSLLFYF